jgi:hypothetical protein
MEDETIAKPLPTQDNRKMWINVQESGFELAFPVFDQLQCPRSLERVTTKEYI